MTPASSRLKWPAPKDPFAAERNHLLAVIADRNAALEIALRDAERQRERVTEAISHVDEVRRMLRTIDTVAKAQLTVIDELDAELDQLHAVAARMHRALVEHHPKYRRSRLNRDYVATLPVAEAAS